MSHKKIVLFTMVFSGAALMYAGDNQTPEIQKLCQSISITENKMNKTWNDLKNLQRQIADMLTDRLESSPLFPDISSEFNEKLNENDTLVKRLRDISAILKDVKNEKLFLLENKELPFSNE